MNKIKHMVGVLIIMMMAGTVFAENHPFNIGDSDYSQLLQKSIVSTGNNYRLKKVIEKAKKGEKVYIAALGGSVTEGAGPQKFTDGYAYQFFRAFKAKYAPGEGTNIYFNDAGLSGTPSTLGRIRYQSDVVDVCGQNPDLLIVEFAVNDGGEPLFQRSFEAIVRDALLASPDTAVIAFYCAATYGNTSAQKKPVADYYEIPHVNMLDIVNEEIKKGTFTKEQYYTDTVHPTYEGHQLMCDCLIKLVAAIDAEKSDSKNEVPAKLYKEPGFSNLIRITGDDSNVKITKGSFTQTDKSTQTIKKTNKANFPQNWYRPMDLKSTNEPFVIKLNCKNLFITYKVQGSWSSEVFGKAEIYVDGKLYGTYDGGAKGGWNNCETLLVIDGTKAENHTVEVKMAAGSEKKGFTIVAMGYSK